MKYIQTDRTVLSLEFSPDGKRLASGGWKHVGLWEIDAGSFTEIVQPDCLVAPRVAFSKDGSHLAWLCWLSENAQLEIRVADLKKVKQTASKVLTAGTFVELATLPNGNVLTVVDAASTCMDLTSLEQVPWSAILPYKGTVTIWQSAMGRIPTICRGQGQPQAALNDVPNGTPIARTQRGRMAVWKVGDRSPMFAQEQPPVQAVAFTPDGRTLIACEDRKVCQWETATWQKRELFDWEIGVPQCLAVSPDGLTAAASGYSGDIVVWDIET